MIVAPRRCAFAIAIENLQSIRWTCRRSNSAAFAVPHSAAQHHSTYLREFDSRLDRCACTMIGVRCSTSVPIRQCQYVGDGATRRAALTWSLISNTTHRAPITRTTYRVPRTTHQSRHRLCRAVRCSPCHRPRRARSTPIGCVGDRLPKECTSPLYNSRFFPNREGGRGPPGSGSAPVA